LVLVRPILAQAWRLLTDSVNVALPAIQSSLHATSSDVQWVVESYLFRSRRCCCWRLAGDIFGRAKVSLWRRSVCRGVAWCGFAPSITSLMSRAACRAPAQLLVPGACLDQRFVFGKPPGALLHVVGITSITAALGPV